MASFSGGPLGTDAQPGYRLIGRYRLVAVIGSGGFGRVWEAVDEQLNRPVAVKEVTLSWLPPAQHEERLERARREGRNAAALADHPAIVSVYDVVIEYGMPWIVMQLVRGRSLRDTLLSDPSDPESVKVPLEEGTVAQIAEAMLSALSALHQAGIVHRDIKPANILIADDGRALLTDFGIAKAETDSSMTVSGSVMGSMAYIAPERAEGEDGGPASDLFSLGVTLFESVEGISAFEKKSSKTGTLAAILTKPLPPMTHAGRLAPLIEALTLKVPRQRPTADQALALLLGMATDWATASRVKSEDAEFPRMPPANAGKAPLQTVTLTTVAALPRPAGVETPPAAPPQNHRSRVLPLAVGTTAVLVAAVATTVAVILTRSSDDSGVTQPPAPTRPIVGMTTPLPATTNSAGTPTSVSPSPLSFSTDELLSTGFKDAGGADFLLTYNAAEDCSQAYQSAFIDGQFKADGCTQMMTADYLEQTRTTGGDSPILVSIEVIPFPTAEDASKAYGLLYGSEYRQNIWCPPQGVGQTPCSEQSQIDWKHEVAGTIRHQNEYLIAVQALRTDHSSATDVWSAIVHASWAGAYASGPTEFRGGSKELISWY